MSSEKKEKSVDYKLGQGCSGHTYQDVKLRLICHKCGQGMKYEVAKTRCEFCDHPLGMMPRVVEDDTFEVVV
jgi:Zn finger protein HypA/HybF involved in hydrogenase expression